MTIAQFVNMSTEQAAHFMAGKDIQPVRKRLAEIVGKHRVIDIGCGPGFEIKELFDPHTYFGIDCSRELVLIARQRNPGFAFASIDALSVEGHWDFAIVKAVLEHLPEADALAIYDHARSISDTLLVAWHTEPSMQPEYATYQGELGQMQQNRHNLRAFAGNIARERCGAHVIWHVT